MCAGYNPHPTPQMNAAVTLFSSSLLFVTSAAIGSLVFYRRARPSWREWVVVVAGAAVLWWQLGLAGGPIARLMLVAAYVSVSAFVVSALLPFVDRAALATRPPLLPWMALPPVILFGVAVGMNVLGGVLAGPTVDASLYRADAAFGIGQPAFTIAAYVLQRPWLNLPTEAAYINQPLMNAVIFAALWNRSTSNAWRFFSKSLTVGVIGAMLYALCPGVGTIATFGDAFPWAPPDAVSPGLLPEVWWPRNCLPSVHTATGLIMLWNTRPGSRLRLATIVYFVAMMLYTVVGGGHYVVDLIAGVPFTVAVEQAIDRRPMPALGATACYLAWVVMVRGELLSASPVVPWLFTVVTLAASLWLRSNRGTQDARLDTARLH